MASIYVRHIAQADKAVVAYTTTPEYEPDEAETLLTDLLADLMHWADSIPKTDFAVALARAEGHYTYEVCHPGEEGL